ncbi:MAG: HAD family hydrolase [bacterium]
MDNKDIRKGILSNSSFSEEALWRELKDFDIDDKFEFLISTSEYCLRKPDKRIFDLALTKFDLNADEVWYVGNSFKYDVIGANNANIQPIWYNVN